MKDRDRTGLFDRVVGRLFGRRRLPPPAAPPPEPAVLRDEHDTWLDQLVIAIGDGRRLDELASAETLGHIDGLWQSGHERLATDWLVKLCAVPEAPADAVMTLRAALVERLEQRRELERGLDHLAALTGHEAHATRAHFLLAEYHRGRGDEGTALRHYEAVLARDVDYANVLPRVERLRAARGLSAPTAGETIAGAAVAGVATGARYRLVRELGRGATGVVYLARDAELDRDVAVKLLHPHLAAAPQADAVKRFFHEARIMASLRHPNLVAVLDLEERARRIVLELAAGGTLRDLLRDRGPRPLRRALERHAQVLSALSAAHRRGIIHRDLKPANLMFRRDPDLPGVEVMLGDFGIAHLPDARGVVGADPSGREAVGTLAYMSPAQRAGDPPSPGDDLHAAAVVLFEMLTGRVPWSREHVLSGERNLDDLRLPERVRSQAPAALVDAVQAHLIELATSDPVAQPTTSAALATAWGLREEAIRAASRGAA